MSLANLQIRLLSSPSVLQNVRSASSIANRVVELSEGYPNRDCAKFLKHNRIWTYRQLRSNCEALTCGWHELGCRTGSTIAIWLPDYVEKIACQIAASIGGFRIVVVDPTLNSVQNFEKIMLETNPRIVVVSEENKESLKAAIPEMDFFASFHDFSGRPFRSRKFTNLRFCSHTGFYLEKGFLQFRNMLAYDLESSPLGDLQAAIDDDSPLSMSYSSEGGNPVAGPIVSHKDTLSKEPSWVHVSKILNKEYVEM